MPPRAVQAALRALFARWGLPERVRADNGWPWGAAGDLPPALALWLLGLGVGVVWNRPRRPQENGIVERFHGLVAPWAEPATCADFAAWRQRLAWLVELQRDRYPVDGTQSRREAWPDLTAVARPYDPAREAEPWDLDRVTAYLAQGLWPRQVDKVGRISLYHRPYSVGRRHAGRRVFVGFDPDALAWVVRDQAGRELRRHPAAQITAERIRHLELSHLRPAQRHLGATQPHGTSEP